MRQTMDNLSKYLTFIYLLLPNIDLIDFINQNSQIIY